MALTPSEVFEGRLRATNQFASGSTWRDPNGQRNQPRVTAHTPEEYNRRQTAPRSRPRTRLQYGGYERTNPYSTVSHTAAEARAKVHRNLQESSFIEASRERNPGLRQRPSPVERNQEPGSGEQRVWNYDPSGGRDIRINIPETLETLPLLGGTTGGGIATTSSLAAGAAVTGGAVGLGALTAAAVNRFKEKGATLPGTDYVGPGNNINIDAPRSASDAIAKEHDINYRDLLNAANAGQITVKQFAAVLDHFDNKAIQQFAENFHNSGEWQSFVGRWGLYFKNRIERVTGPLYPTFPAGKQWAADGKIFTLARNPIGVV